MHQPPIFLCLTGLKPQRLLFMPEMGFHNDACNLEEQWLFVQSDLPSPIPRLPSISNTTAPPRSITGIRNKGKKERSGLQVKKEGRKGNKSKQ